MIVGAVFLKILNMSISASWLALVVMLMRLLLKKAPKAWMVAMWALVGLRLLLPFSIESPLSLLPSAETVPPQVLSESIPGIQSGIPVLTSTVNPMLTQAYSGETAPPPVRDIAAIAAVIWLAGVVLMAVYGFFSYWRIRRCTREAIAGEDGVQICDRISTPFILGLFRPKIYLPSNLEQEHLPYVIAHENAHLKRRDHWWKPLGFALLAVHWFNPLLWLGYVLLCKDIEGACDEAVIRILGTDMKKPYCQALVACSVSRRSIAACPVAFGETGVKSRIKSVLSYKKPTLWIIVLAVLICIVLAVGFLTNPKAVIDDEMKVFVDCQIADHHQSKDLEDRISCLDWQVMGSKKNGKETTLYLWVFYQEYSAERGQLQKENGCHIPTVITMTKENGHYKPVEYWQPRDGSYYVSDIKSKFPWYLWSKATDSQRYVKQQEEACHKMAQEQLEDQLKQSILPTLPVAPGLVDLKPAYPNYFDLPADEGLTVYVWQLASEHYAWGLLPGKNNGYTQLELLELLGFTGTSTQEMQKIVASYQLPKSEITICPIHMPHSSYYYEIDEAYRQKVEKLFWTGYPSQALLYTPYESYLIDSAVFDIDGDGIEEFCQLTPGPTSGVFTFQLSVYQDGVPEYSNTYSSPYYHLSFETSAWGETRLRGETTLEPQEVHYFSFGVDQGNITLVSDAQTMAYWGEQGLDAPFAPEHYGLAPVDQAIFDAVQAHYRDQAPEGTLPIQSYRVLTQEEISGTPTVNESVHRKQIRFYLLVAHINYAMDTPVPEEVSGNFALTVLTFDVDQQEQYHLQAYSVWEQGEYTEEEIRAAFPPEAADIALNLEANVEDLTAECFAKAKEILGA